MRSLMPARSRPRSTDALVGGNELKNSRPQIRLRASLAIDGRRVILHGDLIRGGSAGAKVGDKMGWAIKQAYMRRLPFVARLLDATGGSVGPLKTIGPHLPVDQ